MKIKKIIFLAPDLNIGGGEKVISELSLNLPNYIKKDIVLFKSRSFYQHTYPYSGELHFLDLPISKNFISRAYCFFLGIQRFKKLVKKNNPDWVISLGMPANFINILSCPSKSILRVDNFLSVSCRGLEGSIYKKLIKLLFKKSKKIISVSQGTANDLIKNFKVKKEKVKVIYNPIDVKKIENLAKKSVGEKYQKIFKYPVIINIGRLTEQKGQEHLIEAFKRTKKDIKNLKLIILGEGELEKNLKELTGNLGLEKDIYFLGWQKNPFKFLSRSKLFVFSSLWEGLGISILEAMACGVPVISTDCNSGPREILAPNTFFAKKAKDIEFAEYGILVPPQKEEKLSQAITKTLQDENLLNNLIKKSKQRSNDFGVKKIIKQWKFI